MSWQLSEASLKELVLPTWFASITDLQITKCSCELTVPLICTKYKSQVSSRSLLL